MRILLTLFAIFLLASTAQAQRLNEEYITAEDIQIRFPGAALAGQEVWGPVTVISIDYSADAMREHIDKARLGLQGWECEIPGDVFEKCLFVIEVLNFPRGFRIMEIRARVRSVASNGTLVIGPWGSVNSVQIIGKPGDLFRTH